uniref:H15 domain-containing protein n=1 Tax=Strongyloides papillosus TaxID=174720 RepID=A0A0N5BD88_STREA
MLSCRRIQSDSVNTCSKKRKGPEVHSTSFKKERKEEPQLNLSLTSSDIDDKENLENSEFSQSLVINVVEATINSFGEGSVNISTIKEFLGIKHSEFSSHLLRLTDQYDLFDNIKKKKRKN